MPDMREPYAYLDELISSVECAIQNNEKEVFRQQTILEANKSHLRHLKLAVNEQTKADADREVEGL